MILFTLRCSHGHEFEGWFRDGDGFEAQQKAGEIACPECGQTAVEKAVMAPRRSLSRSAVQRLEAIVEWSSEPPVILVARPPAYS